MRLISLSLAAIFLTSCAYQGVIVQKESRPFPLYESVGVDGMYSFLLRDNSGAVHRQMVTPEVFMAYSEGQYFNDQQPLASGGEFKQTEVASAKTQTTPSTHIAHTAAEPARVATPRRVTAAPPPIETTQSFRASEMQRSSHSMTATLRTEVRNNDEPAESDGMKSAPAASTASSDHDSTASMAKEKSSTHNAARSKKSKSKPAGAKSAKPWRETDPTVETTAPQPPSEGPAEATPAPSPTEPDNSVKLREDKDAVTIPPPQP